jgi:hypothetical protein
MSGNPKGIVSFSPGLQGASYPGCERKNDRNPEGVAWEVRETIPTRREKSALQICAITLFASFSVIAHDSPEHQIEALNKKIAANGVTAELLARRATEWRALGKYDEASQDLQKALVINSNSIPLILECASVELERGNVCTAGGIVETWPRARAGNRESPVVHNDGGSTRTEGRAQPGTRGVREGNGCRRAAARMALNPVAADVPAWQARASRSDVKGRLREDAERGARDRVDRGNDRCRPEQ